MLEPALDSGMLVLARTIRHPATAALWAHYSRAAMAAGRAAGPDQPLTATRAHAN